ncbi:MazG nucleotide pyrophosphohydrolase domain protein [Streptococcus sp. oral taxon 058 str. F0407]|nr:MazG nucleotide pyrophosphohydrolase domain protein [Streptococcus sp. oral taxon 058 str. F0407]
MKINQKSGTKVSLFCEEKMKDLTIRQLQAYLLEHYQQSRTEEGLFIKLVEEVGEMAEVLNGRSGRKEGVQDSNEELAKELADIIHYTVAIAAINDIDLTKTIFEKDKKSAIKYQHEQNLEQYLEGNRESNETRGLCME